MDKGMTYKETDDLIHEKTNKFQVAMVSMESRIDTNFNKLFKKIDSIDDNISKVTLQNVEQNEKIKNIETRINDHEERLSTKASKGFFITVVLVFIGTLSGLFWFTSDFKDKTNDNFIQIRQEVIDKLLD